MVGPLSHFALSARRALFTLVKWRFLPPLFGIFDGCLAWHQFFSRSVTGALKNGCPRIDSARPGFLADHVSAQRKFSVTASGLSLSMRARPLQFPCLAAK